MSDWTPEPDEDGLTWPKPGGHYGDHRADLAWAPERRYPHGPMVGAGRWCPIYAPVDNPRPVGILYTDDQTILGWIMGDSLQNPMAATITQVVNDALLGAAALGTPVSEVFDHWAARDGRGLAAGPVVTGDLRELQP